MLSRFRRLCFAFQGEATSRSSSITLQCAVSTSQFFSWLTARCDLVGPTPRRLISPVNWSCGTLTLILTGSRNDYSAVLNRGSADLLRCFRGRGYFWLRMVRRVAFSSCRRLHLRVFELCFSPFAEESNTYPVETSYHHHSHPFLLLFDVYLYSVD